MPKTLKNKKVPMPKDAGFFDKDGKPKKYFTDKDGNPLLMPIIPKGKLTPAGNNVKKVYRYGGNDLFPQVAVFLIVDGTAYLQEKKKDEVILYEPDEVQECFREARKRAFGDAKGKKG